MNNWLVSNVISVEDACRQGTRRIGRLIRLEDWDFRFFNLKNLNSSRKLDSPVASAYGRSERSRAAPICHAVDNSNPRLRYVEGTELQRWNRRPL